MKHERATQEGEKRVWRCVGIQGRMRGSHPSCVTVHSATLTAAGSVGGAVGLGLGCGVKAKDAAGH